MKKYDIRQIADALSGTCDSIDDVLDRLEIDADVTDIEDELVNVNLERCPDCGWWVESGELVDENGDIVGCEQCRPNTESE